jgi:multiple sugar transport system permease protein
MARSRQFINRALPKALLGLALTANTLLCVFGLLVIVVLSASWISGHHPINALAEIFVDAKARHALGNTFLMFLLSMLIQIFFLVWATLAIRRISLILKFMLLIPFASGTVAPALGFYILFSSALGPFHNFSIFNFTWGAPLLIAALDAWQWIGILLVAAFTRLERIPSSMFEQCSLEGIGLRFQWRYIVLPRLTPVILFYSCFKFLDWLRKTDAVRSLFDAGGPSYNAENVSVYITRLFFGGDASYAAALALIQLALLLIGIVAIVRWSLRETSEILL